MVVSSKKVVEQKADKTAQNKGQKRWKLSQTLFCFLLSNHIYIFLKHSRINTGGFLENVKVVQNYWVQKMYRDNILGGTLIPLDTLSRCYFVLFVFFFCAREKKS